MGENVRRTVKRNSKERDKDAHSGTKCDRQKPLPSKKTKNMGTRRWLLEVFEIARGGTDDSKNDEFKYTNCVVDSKCGHSEC